MKIGPISLVGLRLVLLSMAALATDFVQSGDSLRLLGHDDRVAMTARATHVPTTEALAIELDFLEHWFKR